MCAVCNLGEFYEIGITVQRFSTSFMSSLQRMIESLAEWYRINGDGRTTTSRDLLCRRAALSGHVHLLFATCDRVGQFLSTAHYYHTEYFNLFDSLQHRSHRPYCVHPAT